MKTLFNLLLVSIIQAFVCHAETGTVPAQGLLGRRMQTAVLRDQNIEEVREILDAGFDINAPIGCGSHNALDGAVHTENMDLLKFLLEKGAKPTGRALIAATRLTNPDTSLSMVEDLLQAGADPNYKENHPNKSFHSPLPLSTPLHSACHRGHVKVVELLVNTPGIEINTLNVDNQTPLMVAVEGGCEDIIRLLLNKGADPKIRNANGKTAMDIAREQIHKRELILQRIDSKANAESRGRSSDLGGNPK